MARNISFDTVSEHIEQPLLSVRSVTRQFGGHTAVDAISFDLPKGSLTALIGPNGAGKTTLFNLIAGSLAPTRGEIRCAGEIIISPQNAYALGIARTFQNVRLFPNMTVRENIMTGMGATGFLQACLPTSRAWHEERLRMKKAFYLLQEAGVHALADQVAGGIPFGQQRLVEIARAMALKPRLLLLDEPAAGLNATETVALSGLIRRLHDQGTTVLLVEHDMSLVMNLAHRILVLDRGALIFDGPPAEAQRDEKVCAAYLGTGGQPCSR